MWNLKETKPNKNKNTLIDTENKIMVARGKGEVFVKKVKGNKM